MHETKRSTSRFAALRATRSTALFIALGATLLACADVPRAFGPNVSAARTNANALFGGLANRFTNVVRSQKYAHAREIIGRNALTPSVIFNDTSVWTVVGDDNTRTLFGDAEFTNGKYVFVNTVRENALQKAGDGRHVMRLTKLKGDDEYQWFTSVDFAAGSITAEDLNRVVNALLASAEGRSGQTLHANARTAFPRTSEALGKLFTIDTIISVPDNQGGNTVSLSLHVTPDNIRDAYPNYASYIDKYVKRVKLHFGLFDRTGARWFDMTVRDGNIVMRTRSANGGHFAPLEGPLRPIPDTLSLRLDATAKISLFTVGVSKLVGEWINVQTPHERTWAMRFTKEPDWELPPIVGRLIRSPLHRPFEGEGTIFRIGFTDAPGRQTLMSRRMFLNVQESGVIRFLGKLGGTAMGDFVAKVETEENRFNASIFSALQADSDALLH